MQELDVVLGEAGHAACNLRHGVSHLLVTTYLLGLATLKPAPSTIDVVLAVETGAIPFDTGLRRDEYRLLSHYGLPILLLMLAFTVPKFKSGRA